MPKYQTHELNTYEKLNNYLGTKTERKFSKNCIIFRGSHRIGEQQKNLNAIFIKLYQSIIVIHLEIGIQVIPFCSYDSPTTTRYVRGFTRKEV